MLCASAEVPGPDFKINFLCTEEVIACRKLQNLGAALSKSVVFLLPCTSPCLGNRAELRARVPSVTRTTVKTPCTITFHNVFIYSTRNEDFFVFVCAVDDFCSQEHEVYELLYLPEFFCYLLLSQVPNLCSRLCTNTMYKVTSAYVANRRTRVVRPP